MEKREVLIINIGDRGGIWTLGRTDWTLRGEIACLKIVY